jgi:hypothetical protein
MGKIHFIGGEKGVVGKSLVSRLLAQYFIDHELPFVGFDTDKSHGSLLRFYAGFASPVIVDRYESLDRVMEAAVEDPDRRILVDLAAQTHQFLAKWIDDSALFDLSEEIGVELMACHGFRPRLRRFVAQLAESVWWQAQIGGRIERSSQ